MDALIALYLNVAEYLEESYRKWQEAVDREDAVAMMPRWTEAHQGNLDAAKHWRDKAAELVRKERHGKRPINAA